MSDHEPRREPIEISLVCAVGRHAFDLLRVHREFRDVLDRIDRSAEFIYVLEASQAELASSLATVCEDRFPIRILRMAKGFGEAMALQIGFDRAVGRYVLTITDRPQVEARVIEDVLAELDGGAQVVVTRREPRADPLLNRLQASIFNKLVRRLVHQDFRDMGCGVRGFTRRAARGLDLYGDQHSFIPILACRRGYRVVEIPGRQHVENRNLRLYRPGVYVRRLLDILNIYFLTSFTRKPLRFFGLIGATIGGVGFAICTYLAILRLGGATALADKPLLILGVLLLTVGVQVTSIGLLGEIIIFLSSKRATPEVEEYGSEADSVDTEPSTPSSGRLPAAGADEPAAVARANPSGSVEA